jgi:hypothetical protein
MSDWEGVEGWNRLSKGLGTSSKTVDRVIGGVRGPVGGSKWEDLGVCENDPFVAE